MCWLGSLLQIPQKGDCLLKLTGNLLCSVTYAKSICLMCITFKNKEVPWHHRVHIVLPFPLMSPYSVYELFSSVGQSKSKLHVKDLLMRYFYSDEEITYCFLIPPELCKRTADKELNRSDRCLLLFTPSVFTG